MRVRLATVLVLFTMAGVLCFLATTKLEIVAYVVSLGIVVFVPVILTGYIVYGSGYRRAFAMGAAVPMVMLAASSLDELEALSLRPSDYVRQSAFSTSAGNNESNGNIASDDLFSDDSAPDDADLGVAFGQPPAIGSSGGTAPYGYGRNTGGGYGYGGAQYPYGVAFWRFQGEARELIERTWGFGTVSLVAGFLCALTKALLQKLKGSGPPLGVSIIQPSLGTTSSAEFKN